MPAIPTAKRAPVSAPKTNNAAVSNVIVDGKTRFELEQEARQRFVEVLTFAKERFNLEEDIVGTAVNFDMNSGSTLGMFVCTSRGIYGKRKIENMRFRINPQMLSNAGNFKELISDTIPHEVAHLVATLVCGVNENHGQNWQHIARVLGCNGERLCQASKVTIQKIRKTRKFEYILASGAHVEISTRVHNKMQGGARYLCDGERMTKEHFVKEI